jgi:FkbM family methyltransferase
MIEHKECRYGPMLYLSNDEWVGRSFRLYGEAFQNQINFMMRFIRPYDWVLDAGANMGAMTIPFAKVAHKVIAFEPQEFLYYTLCGNIAINNLYNVSAYMNAVDAVSGRQVYFPSPSAFYDQDTHFAGVGLCRGERDNADREVATVALDDLELERLDFIKLDVEGNELLAMRGAEQILERFKPVVFVECSPDTVDGILAALNHHQYTGYVVGTDYYNPSNYFGNRENVLGQQQSGDVICWHRSQDDEMKPCFEKAIEECDGVVSFFCTDDPLCG